MKTSVREELHTTGNHESTAIWESLATLLQSVNLLALHIYFKLKYNTYILGSKHRRVCDL